MRKAIVSNNGPRPRGPYTLGIVAHGPFPFVSGHGPIDPPTDEIVKQTFERQVHQTLTNLQAIVKDAGGRLEDAVKVTVYLSDMADFSIMNSIYESFFEPPPPARTTVQSGLVGSDIEIDAIVQLGGDRLGGPR